MNLKRKVIIWSMAAGIGISGLLAIAPAYADYDHHWHYHHYHHDGGAIAAGIVGAGIIGMMIGSAMNHHDDYYGDCREVYYTRHCAYDGWGDRRCYEVEHIHYEC